MQSDVSSKTPITTDVHSDLSRQTSQLSATRIVCVYENQPLSCLSTFAVPRLLSQLIQSIAAIEPSVECLAISPVGSTLAGVRTLPSEPSRIDRARCRLLGHRVVRKFRGAPSIETTLPYQIGRAGLVQLSDTSDQRTIVIVATMTAAILARRTLPESRIVYWVQGMPRLGQESLASQAVNAVDAIVAPSKALYRDLFELICRNRFAPPVWVIPNTIDGSQFKPESQETIGQTRAKLGIEEDDVAIMHIGRAPEKGLQVARAALAVGNLDHPVVLISAGGKHKGRQRIHDRAEVLEIGRVTPSDLNRMYQACDLGVVPSVWWENCPLALIEMMSLGLCPIGSRVGGIPEMIEHGKSGLIVDAPNDANAWASAINKVVSDRAFRDRLGAEARRSASTRFSQTAALSKWHQILSGIPQVS